MGLLIILTLNVIFLHCRQNIQHKYIVMLDANLYNTSIVSSPNKVACCYYHGVEFLLDFKHVFVVKYCLTLSRLRICCIYFPPRLIQSL